MNPINIDFDLYFIIESFILDASFFIFNLMYFVAPNNLIKFFRAYQVSSPKTILHEVMIDILN